MENVSELNIDKFSSKAFLTWAILTTLEIVSAKTSPSDRKDAPGWRYGGCRRGQ